MFYPFCRFLFLHLNLQELTSKPCSVYETIDNRGTPHPVTPGVRAEVLPLRLLQVSIYSIQCWGSYFESVACKTTCSSAWQ